MKKATLIAVFAVFAVLASGCKLLTDLDATGSLSPGPEEIVLKEESITVLNDTADFVDIDVAQVGTCPTGSSTFGEIGAATGKITIDSLSFDVKGVLCDSGAAPSIFDLDEPSRLRGNFGVWYSADNPDDVEYMLVMLKLAEESEYPGEILIAVLEGYRFRYSEEYLYLGTFTEGVTVESIMSSIDRAIAAGEISVWEGQALQQTLDVVQNLADLGLTQVADLVLTGLIRTTDFRSGDFYDNLGDQLSEWEPGQS